MLAFKTPQGILAVLLFALAVPAARAGPAPDKKTERLWKAKCSSCHGVDGKAQTEQGKLMSLPDLSSAAWQKATTDERIRDQILNGVKKEKDGKAVQMDPFKGELQPEQVDALIGYVRSLSG
jgi:mono/diheme cytochrome c family protein